jgi:hypothetical protein
LFVLGLVAEDEYPFFLGSVRKVMS